MLIKNKDSMLVRWEDNSGNLFEANISQNRLEGRVYAYLKQWTTEDKNPTMEGTHKVLWQAEAPPAEPIKLKYTIKRKSAEYGCPKEHSIQFLDVEIT